MNIPNESPLATGEQQKKLTPNQIKDLEGDKKAREQNDVPLMLQQDSNFDEDFGIDVANEYRWGYQALMERGAKRHIIRKTEPLS